MNNKNPKIIIFDLDETLTESKSALDNEMAILMDDLLKRYRVAVISGGSFKQFERQFLPFLKPDLPAFKNLLILPTCGSSFYLNINGKWELQYSEVLKEDEKEKIKSAFLKTFIETGYRHPEKIYGEIIEDRDTQISFSALGQEAPVAIKKAWDPDGKKRMVLIEVMKKYAPEFEIRIGGSTTIDVTHKGIDKAYGIRKIENITGIKIEDMIFIGDKLYPGGNDYPARETGVECLPVKGPEETKKIIKELLK